ncbi:MAG: competence protein CoiA family protein [Omnitrophica WOR_2 bacterium]
MYKAIHQPGGEEILILDSRWRRQIPYLRQQDRQDLLVCQGCQKPVRVRAGKVKRWHFAHKHLENCPYEIESPALLNTRAQLYEWLVRQFGEAAVTAEKKIPGSNLPRPVDGWAKINNLYFAYWIIDRRLPPDIRDLIHNEFKRMDAFVHWIFLSEMLNEETRDPGAVYLTTTEREFMQETGYDEILSGKFPVSGKTLHYIDPDMNAMITFRALRLAHSPQLFKGHKESHPIVELAASKGTGEFIHPGEDERRLQIQEVKQRFGSMEKSAARKFSDERQGYSQLPGAVTGDPSGIPAPDSAENLFTLQEATCIYCGKKTTEWWYLNRTDKTCKCKDCLKRGLS